MYTAARHRHATRWPRRLVFAFVILLLLAAGWRFYRASRPQAPQVRGQLV